MKKKIYFPLDEIKRVIFSITTPVGIFDFNLNPIAANYNFICDLNYDKRFEDLLDINNLKLLLESVKNKTDVSLYYRKNAFDQYTIYLKWMRCVYSGNYYCFAIAIKGSNLEEEKHFGAISLILSSLKESLRANEITFDKLMEIKSLNDINKEDICNRVDDIAIGILKNNRLQQNIDLLINFMNDIWPDKKDYFNIYTIVQEIVKEYNSMKLPKKATFKVTTNTDNASIYCDNKYMAKALLNIITNLLQLSSRENTTIHIDINAYISDVDIDIYSNRIMIDEPTAKTVMHGDSLNEHGKTYFGLYVANTIINRFKGSMKFTSNAKEGTKIHIFMPVYQSSKYVTFRCDPINPDFSFINNLAKTEFSVLY